MTQKLKVVVHVPSLDPNLDGFTNNFAFETSDTPPYSNIGGLFTKLEAIYNTSQTGASNPVVHYLAPSLDNGTNHSTITAYDISTHLDGSPHGSPVASTTWTCGSPGAAASSTCVPEGCSAVVSFRADYGTDVEFGTGSRPRARDRNRIYVGPIGQPLLQYDSTTQRVEFSSTAIGNILHNFNALTATTTSGGTTYDWRVWSRKAADVKLITELWMDDRPDYQRRRTDPTPGSRIFMASLS